jgi:hypothetical protein
LPAHPASPHLEFARVRTRVELGPTCDGCGNPAFDHWRTISTAPMTVVAQGNGNLLAFITWRID